MSIALQQHLVLPTLLARLAEDLTRCRSVLARIEVAVHHGLDAAKAGEVGTDPPVYWQSNLQDIDLLDQHLADLAVCVQAIAADPAVQQGALLSGAHVLGPLKLDDLRKRLRGDTSQAEDASNIELF
ncbi:MAG: hypothetical protein ACOH2M_15610 [Cypionkella sp.]|jgi:hypothetical protein